MLVAGLVLAIGAANLAGLMMTRGVARRRDVAIRLTLGATRTQIARQMVTETLLLAIAGGLAGVALSRVFVTTLLGDMAQGFGGTYSRLASLGVPVDRRVILVHDADLRRHGAGGRSRRGAADAHDERAQRHGE